MSLDFDLISVDLDIFDSFEDEPHLSSSFLDAGDSGFCPKRRRTASVGDQPCRSPSPQGSFSCCDFDWLGGTDFGSVDGTGYPTSGSEFHPSRSIVGSQPSLFQESGVVDRSGDRSFLESLGGPFLEDMDSVRGLSVQVPCMAVQAESDSSDELAEFGDLLQNTESGSFRLDGKCFHLTYRGHIHRSDLFRLFGGEAACQFWSCVHERGSHKSEGGEPYDHTHFYCRLHSRVTRKGPRCLDINGVHPYIQKISSQVHEGRLYWVYHRKSPIQLWQSTEAPKDPTLTLDRARKREAIFRGSLLDAAEALSIDLRTLADIKAVREERVPAAPAQSRYSRDDFCYDLNWQHSYSGSNFTTCCIYLYGGAGLGKTEFALSLFERPLLVRSLDQARDFHPDRYDAIVFDDANIHHLCAEAKIHLADFTQPSQVQCRYTNANIPAFTKRVFTSNKSPEEFWKGRDMSDDQFEAIRRRVKFIHIRGKLFK